MKWINNGQKRFDALKTSKGWEGVPDEEIERIQDIITGFNEIMNREAIKIFILCFFIWLLIFLPPIYLLITT